MGRCLRDVSLGALALLITAAAGVGAVVDGGAQRTRD